MRRERGIGGAGDGAGGAVIDLRRLSGETCWESVGGMAKGEPKRTSVWASTLSRGGENKRSLVQVCVLTTIHGRKQVRPWEQGEIEARSLAGEQCTKGVKR